MNEKRRIDEEFFRDKAVFIPSFDCGLDNRDLALFFYHLGKTGGTTVWGFLMLLARLKGGKTYKLARDLAEPPSSVLDAEVYWVVGGHALYGYHEHFDSRFSLATMVREPVGRIISDYFWTYRKEDEAFLKDHSNFVRYLNSLARHNHQTNVILSYDGGTEDPWHLPLSNEAPVELALERLSGFKYLTTTSNLKMLLTVISSVNGGPAVWIERGKVNSLLALKEEFRHTYGDEILSRNQCDARLVSYAEERSNALTELYDQVRAYPQKDARYALVDANTPDGFLSMGKSYGVIDLNKTE